MIELRECSFKPLNTREEVDSIICDESTFPGPRLSPKFRKELRNACLEPGQRESSSSSICTCMYMACGHGYTCMWWRLSYGDSAKLKPQLAETDLGRSLLRLYGIVDTGKPKGSGQQQDHWIYPVEYIGDLECLLCCSNFTLS